MVILEGFGFLRGDNRPMLLKSGPAGSDGGGFFSRSSEEGEGQEEERIQGRAGSQGGGEVFVSSAGEPGEEGRDEPANTAVAADEMLRAYGDSFDLVACGGHSMDLVADFVRHFVGASPQQ